MAILEFPSDCGNAPRKLLLKKFCTMLVHGDAGAVAECLHEDAVWHIAGFEESEGLSRITANLLRHPLWKATELRVDTMITPGRAAAASGRALTAEGDRIRFCDLYRFKSAGSNQIVIPDGWNLQPNTSL